jgi:hypothetical protein
MAPEYKADGVQQLFGRYRITMSATSLGLTRQPFSAQLLLGPPDTVRHYYPERYQDARALLGQQIAGVWTQQGDSGVYVDNVSYENKNLYLGCRICLDASPLRFTIERIGPTGFWGRWEDPQTGIDRAYDTAGRKLPNPAGVYCAVLQSDSL